MKTKELVAMALFVAIGAALHAVIPPFFYGMKPDMMLIMMFMGILLFPRLQNVAFCCSAFSQAEIRRRTSRLLAVCR